LMPRPCQGLQDATHRKPSLGRQHRKVSDAHTYKESSICAETRFSEVQWALRQPEAS